MDTVPKEIHVVSVVTKWPLATAAEVRDEKDDRISINTILSSKHQMLAPTSSPLNFASHAGLRHLHQLTRCRLLLFELPSFDPSAHSLPSSPPRTPLFPAYFDGHFFKAVFVRIAICHCIPSFSVRSLVPQLREQVTVADARAADFSSLNAESISSSALSQTSATLRWRSRAIRTLIIASSATRTTYLTSSILSARYSAFSSTSSSTSSISFPTPSFFS